MKCEFCGTELKEGDKVCSACGAPVEGKEQTLEEKIFNDPVAPVGEEVNVAVVEGTEVKDELPVVDPTPTEAPAPVSDIVNTTPVVEEPKKKGLAIASLIIGIICMLGGNLTLILPIIGLVLGICNKDKCGQKTAGIILNAIALVLAIILIPLLIALTHLVVNYTEEDLENIQDQVEDLVNDTNEAVSLDGDWVIGGDNKEGWKFDNGTFYWYKDVDNKDDYYWSGTFIIESVEDNVEHHEVGNKILTEHPNYEVTLADMYYLQLMPNKAVVDGEDTTATAIPEGLVWKYMWTHLKTYDTDTKTFYYVYNLDDETMNYEISRYAPYNY